MKRLCCEAPTQLCWRRPLRHVRHWWSCMHIAIKAIMSVTGTTYEQLVGSQEHVASISATVADDDERGSMECHVRLQYSVRPERALG
jgi:hypothetical protein